MQLTEQIANQVRELHFGKNWTSSSLKDNLEGITWQQAATQVDSLNTIAVLVYHMNYYVSALVRVLQGEPLDAHDHLSFETPSIRSQKDWEELLEKTWTDAATFAALIEQLPESKLWETMADENYGNYYRNICAIIEHNHYHLGQIALLKKILLRTDRLVGTDRELFRSAS